MIEKQIVNVCDHRELKELGRTLATFAATEDAKTSVFGISPSEASELASAIERLTGTEEIKDDPNFTNIRDIRILADVLEQHAAARAANEKIRSRIKESIDRIPNSDLKHLVGSTLLSDYMQASFSGEELGDLHWHLKCFDEDDNCILFTIDTETLCAVKWGCESVVNEATKNERTQQ